MEYIYLLQEREFIKTGEPIYKVGMTKQANLARFKSYPNGSTLLFHIACDNSRAAESAILVSFRTKFYPETFIGAEYFRGDYRLMIKEMFDIIYDTRIPEIKEKFNNKYITPSISDKDRDIILDMVKFYMEIDGFNHKQDLFFGGNQVIINPELFNFKLDFVDDGEWDFLMKGGKDGYLGIEGPRETKMLSWLYPRYVSNL
jgi:hypothetical protein